MKPQALTSQPPAAPGPPPRALAGTTRLGSAPQMQHQDPSPAERHGPCRPEPSHRCPTGPPASGGKPLFCTSSEGTCELPLGNLGGVEDESASRTALPSLHLGQQRHSPDVDVAVVPALPLWHWESHFSRYGGDGQFRAPGFSNSDGCKEQSRSRSREPSRPLSQPRGLNTRGQQGPAWPPAQPPLPLMAASGAGRLKAGTARAFPLNARDGAEGGPQGAKAGGWQAITAVVLTRVEAQVTGVEAPDQHAGTQPDALQVTVAASQIDQQDVVQVKLQAGPAGTREGHTWQRCRTRAKVSTYPLTSQATALCPRPAPSLMPTATRPPSRPPPELSDWTPLPDHPRAPFAPHLRGTFPGCPSLTNERELQPRSCRLELLEEVGEGHSDDLAVLWGTAWT